MNEHAKFAIEISEKYADENGFSARKTSDLSPFEQWLIIQLYEERWNPELRISVDECYKCNPDKNWNQNNFNDNDKYACKCGHLFKIEYPENRIFVDTFIVRGKSGKL